MMKFSERAREILEKAMSDDQIERDQADREEEDEKAEDEEEAKSGQAESRTPEQNAAIDKKLLAAQAAAAKKRQTAAEVSKIMSLKKEAADGPTDKDLKDIEKEKPTSRIPKKRYFGGETDPKKVNTAAAIAKHKKDIRAAGATVTGESRSSLALRRAATQQQAAARKKAAQPTSHPSSTQSRMKKELGDEAYNKLSKDNSNENPVQAAKRRAKEKMGEAVQKQARIKLDKEKTAVGATASNQADDPRRSPSLSTSHNSPEGQARRRARLKSKTEAATGTGKQRKFKSGEYQSNTFSANRPQGMQRTSTSNDETDTGRQGAKLPTPLQAKLGAMKKSMKRKTKDISDSKYTQYHNMVKLYLEMCQNCKDDGKAAARKAPEGQKQVAYNKARRGAENKRHGKPGESPRDTQVRRHGRGGIPRETPDVAKADAEHSRKLRRGPDEGKDWIGKAADSIEDRGTEGKCTPITKPGCTGKAKALAKTFKKMGRKRDKAIVSKEGK